MKVRMPTLFLSGLSISEVSLPTTGSGRSGFAISHNGRRLRIGGSASKFSCGGGEVVAHSKVQAFQGLSPAIFPRKNETTRFHTRMSDAAAIKKTPTVESMFIQAQWGRSGYVNTRRGIPWRPRKC